MALRGGDRLRKVLANKGGSEARPGGEENGIYGLRPSVDDRAEACTMEVLHEIGECCHGLDAVDERQTGGCGTDGGGCG